MIHNKQKYNAIKDAKSNLNAKLDSAMGLFSSKKNEEAEQKVNTAFEIMKRLKSIIDEK